MAPKLDVLGLNRNNSAADCLISLMFGTDFYYMAADILQRFKVDGSKVNAT